MIPFIIHRGLKNSPEIKKYLLNSIKELQEVAENETRHLSDTGLLLELIALDIEKLSKVCFKKHEAEKNAIQNISPTNP